MQIHELNKKPRKKQVQEVFQDAESLGREILKNPASWVSGTAMAQTQQSARDQTAAQNAAALSKKGYTTAAGPKKAQDILPQVKSNPATQQMVKTIAGEWQKLAAQLTGQPVKETALNELAPGQVGYSAPTTGYAQRPAGYAQTTTNAPAATTPQATSAGAVQQKQIQARMAQQFTDWANNKLAALRVDVDAINDDASVASTLKTLANKIAANPKSTNDIIEYFNLAIAANIADNQARRAGFYQSAPGQQTAPGQAQATPQQITQQAGLNPQTLQDLGAVLKKADSGTMTMPRTKNPVADAMFQQMGFKLK